MRYAWPSTIWRRQFTSGNQCPDLICAAAASNLFTNFQMSRTPMNYSIGINACSRSCAELHAIPLKTPAQYVSV